MGVHHIMYSPHYHQSNGLAEKDAQLSTGVLYSANKLREDSSFALKLYGSAYLGHAFSSPIELLYARQATSGLSMSHDARMQVKAGLDGQTEKNA